MTQHPGSVADSTSEPQEVLVKSTGNIWSIVLAGGDGSRLSQLAIGPEGQAVPKQYCSVKGGVSLVRRALRRGRAVAGHDRTMVVVAEEHRRWWSAEMVDLPAVHVVVQPCNRGTACGVLLPLMHVLAYDRDATVVVLPSDHVVTDEPTLLEAIAAATDHVHLEPDRLILLGLEPERPDTGLGWISPSTEELHAVFGVSAFFEKPSRRRAEELVLEGALWNSFIFAMRASALFELIESALPWLTRMFSYAFLDAGGGRSSRSLTRLYDRLPSVDFSRAVLEATSENMRVVAVPPCGWTDVGTPEGIARCSADCAGRTADAGSVITPPPLDLAVALSEFLDQTG